MQNPQNQFLAELTQLFGDIDEMIPQFTAFADHHAGLAEVGQFALHPALGVVAGSVQFILNDINRAREGDVLAVLQVAHFLTAISTAISIFTENPAHPLAASAGLHSEVFRQLLARYLGR